jgi:hypothetical protein
MKFFGLTLIGSGLAQFVEFRGTCPEIPLIADFDVGRVRFSFLSKEKLKKSYKSEWFHQSCSYILCCKTIFKRTFFCHFFHLLCIIFRTYFVLLTKHLRMRALLMFYKNFLKKYFLELK